MESHGQMELHIQLVKVAFLEVMVLHQCIIIQLVLESPQLKFANSVEICLFRQPWFAALPCRLLPLLLQRKFPLGALAFHQVQQGGHQVRGRRGARLSAHPSPGGAGEAEGGVEGAGLLGRAGGEGSLAESLLCLVQSDLIQVQDISRHLHTYHSLCQNDHRNKKITVHSSLSPRPASQLEKRIQLPDYTGASPSTRVVESLEKISLHQFFHMHRQLLSIVQTPTVLHKVLNKNQCALHLNLMRSDSQIYTYQSSIHAPVKYTRITRSNIHHSPKHTLIGTQRGKLVYFQQDR